MATPAPLSKRRFVTTATRLATLLLAVTLAGCAGKTAPVATPAVSTGSTTETVTVALTNFAFTPDRITLRAGVPVRLRLVNQSTGDHDFSASGFFAASSFSAGSTAPPDGKVEVAPQQTVEFALTPRVAGSYPVECTHFLHSLFGMTATIDVVS